MKRSAALVRVALLSGLLVAGGAALGTAPAQAHDYYRGPGVVYVPAPYYAVPAYRPYYPPPAYYYPPAPLFSFGFSFDRDHDRGHDRHWDHREHHR
jgi:hypothetical protein